MPLEKVVSEAWETSKLGGIRLVWLFWVGVFIWFNCGLITIQKISIVGVPQIGKFISEVWETLKLGGIGLIWLFQVGAFTWFNCGLVTTEDISITEVPQIGEFASGIWETSKLGGIGHLIIPSWGVYLIQLWTCHNSRNFDYVSAKNQRIC